MKKYGFILVLILALFVPTLIFSQSKKNTQLIDYGNNAKVGKYITTRGIKVYYETYGQGEPLLMIHGNGGSISAFKYQIGFFQKHYKVIVADSRAQGKTIDYGEVLNYEMMAEDMNALLDSLHIASAKVIGWSDGGINGLLLAIHHPEKVNKLVISGANLIPDDSVLDPQGVAFIADAKKELMAAKQDASIKNTLKLINMMALEPHIPTTDLQKIKCPVLVIGGDADVIKPSHTVQIFENIPQANLWILPFSGHATMQRSKAEFNSKVFSFFQKPFSKAKWNDWDE
jgi:pimeloyl-ACP methyl ester carboxylesterase